VRKTIEQMERELEKESATSANAQLFNMGVGRPMRQKGAADKTSNKSGDDRKLTQSTGVPASKRRDGSPKSGAIAETSTSGHLTLGPQRVTRAAKVQWSQPMGSTVIGSRSGTTQGNKIGKRTMSARAKPGDSGKEQQDNALPPVIAGREKVSSSVEYC
jgi:hypothetical protein